MIFNTVHQLRAKLTSYFSVLPMVLRGARKVAKSRVKRVMERETTPSPLES